MQNLALAGHRSIVVINHLSFLDGCFVAAFLPGDVVFAVDTEQARRFWFLKYVIDIFPVDPGNPMATKAMVKAVREGRRLAIFPEGRITLTGTLMKIYDGPGMIADKADAAIIPVRIDGLQFHKTSRMAGKLPLRWFPRLSLRDTWLASAELVDRKVVRLAPQVSLQEMLLSFQEVLSRSDMFAHLHVQREPLSVRQRMADVLSALN